MSAITPCRGHELVSVVIPIYNAEATLDECLRSVEEQTHADLEIICVNDGSTDGSARIARDHAARDTRIVVIDKPNEGYGASCNRGVATARGTWVAIVEPDENEEDSEATLIRALEEYKMLKEESAKLKERETLGFYFKPPDKNVGEAKIVYRDLNLDGLLKAFTELMLRREAQRKDETMQREIPKEIYTIPDRASYICRTVEEQGDVSFEDLFSQHAGKSEIITTFQALLELLKHQFVKAEQADTFGRIVIRYNPDHGEEGSFGEFEELE